MKLRFLKSWGYNGEIVRAGAVRSDVSDFWAMKFIADGIAVEERSAVKAVAGRVLEAVGAAPRPRASAKKAAAKKKK